uniref:Methylosome subunit pICln n=1 Tax=Arion vulgaris TaxID=1028688 RepID=A0A0B7BTN3_9EUPU
MVLLINHSVPVEGIQHTEPNVAVDIEGNDLGTGTLYITHSSVLWLNPSDEGIQLEYRQISLHAISRDLQAFPKEHLLCHYDGKLPGVEKSDDEASDDDNNEHNTDFECSLIEIRFIPENKESLAALFEALADCQTLHPDSDCQLSEDEFENADEDGGGDGIFNTEEGMSQLTEQGRANLERMNNLLMGGQGGDDIISRTGQISLVNGHHISNSQADEEQFNDADDMNE